jgi:hypothetical protein
MVGKQVRSGIGIRDGEPRFSEMSLLHSHSEDTLKPRGLVLPKWRPNSREVPEHSYV